MTGDGVPNLVKLADKTDPDRTEVVVDMPTRLTIIVLSRFLAMAARIPLGDGVRFIFGLPGRATGPKPPGQGAPRGRWTD